MSQDESSSEMRESLKDPESRAFYAEQIARDLSKLGTFEFYESEMEILAELLDQAEVVALYERFVESGRLELEWRQEFEEFFDGAESYLPKLRISDAEFDEALGGGDARTLDGQKIQPPDDASLERTHRRSWWKFWR